MVRVGQMSAWTNRMATKDIALEGKGANNHLCQN